MCCLRIWYMQFSTVRLKRSYRLEALFQRKNKNKNKTKTKFKILFRFDEFSWGSIAGVFVALDVLWCIMQCSLKQTESPSFSKNLKSQFCSSRLFQFHIVFFSSLSFYRIPRLKMWQIQKAAPQDIFHRSRKFFVQISMSLILTRSLYQEHLRNVGSLILSMIDVHNEKIHCFT